MPPVAYLFERFPSFGQTFCYREVEELMRQGIAVSTFAIRRPRDEPPQDWRDDIVERVVYLPAEPELVREIELAARRGELPNECTRALKEWGRQTDFLRLYQAAWIGLRLQNISIKRVHAHFAGMAARTAYWMKQFFDIDFSITAHANDIFAPRDFAVSLDKILAAATRIVTVSDFSAGQLAARFPRHAAKLRRVYNGIDVDRFRIATFESQPPVIISIGRLIEKKGFADLISACAELDRSGVAFRCEIIGEGPLQSALEAQIGDAKLTGIVELRGPRTQHEIIDRLSRANAFVLACRTEADGGMDNLPTVIMEAMAAGLPVVSTRVAGVPEMVEHEASGLLVAEGDVDALASAIAKLLDPADTAQRFGTRGREIAHTKFSIAKTVQQLREVLGL